MGSSIISIMLAMMLAEVSDSEKQVALQKASEAFEAAEMSLHSGAGKGTYKIFEQDSMGTWKLMTDADVEIYFDGDKYNVTLVYRLEPMKRTKRVIIYDKSAILSTRFGRIRPAGGETEVFPVGSHPLGLVRPQAADFPWDVTKLPTTLEHVTKLRKTVGDQNLELIRTSEGLYQLSFPVGTNAKVSIDISPDAGYNIVRRRVYAGPSEKLYQEFKATWALEGGGIWYIDRLTEELYSGPSQFRWELEYDEFTPNVPVQPEVFTLGALDMPPGSRILDKRPGVERKDRARWVPNEDSVVEKALDGMLDEVQSLPTERPSRYPIGDRPLLRIILFSTNALVIVLIVAYLIYRRRARRAAVSSG